MVSRMLEYRWRGRGLRRALVLQRERRVWLLCSISGDFRSLDTYHWCSSSGYEVGTVVVTLL